MWINEEDQGNPDGRWQIQPETTVRGDRYGLRTAVWWNTTERSAERFELDLSRRMVDGRFAITYELERDGNNKLRDHSIGVELFYAPCPALATAVAKRR